MPVRIPIIREKSRVVVYVNVNERAMLLATLQVTEMIERPQESN